MEPYPFEWKLRGDSFPDIGFAVVRRITKLAQENMIELADQFPFRAQWELKSHFGNDWLAFRLTDTKEAGVPSVDKLEASDLAEVEAKVPPGPHRSHAALVELLGSEWFSFDRFTYVGPYSPPHASWQHVHEHLVAWLEATVIPIVFDRNKKRVLRAIPPAPQFDVDAITKALWVIECGKTYQQGTAFTLEGVGVVTCQHAIGQETVAFKAGEIGRKYSIAVRSESPDIDLAILDVVGLSDVGLKRGSAKKLSNMDHVAVAGFPNYHVGDTGVVSPGLVVGFRQVSGIERILISAAIVKGNSGGPVLDRDNRVIGVAVTGADRMENAQETENHGVIPIDALKYLTA